MSLEKGNNETARSFKDAFGNWETESPKADLWSKLSESLDREFEKNHTLSDTEQSFSAAFSDWDADAPSDSLWNKLDEDLSQASVWNRLEESLEATSPSNKDAWLAAAYNDWSANTNHDGWSKLDEALSRERVWNRLNISLSRPVALTRSWLKYAASLTAFMFLSFFMNDQFNGTASRFVASSSDNTTPATSADMPVVKHNAPNTDLTYNISQQKKTVPAQRNLNNTNLAVQEQNNVSDNSSANASNNSSATNLAFENVDLGQKTLPFGCTSDIVGLKFPKANFSNWTIGIGTQLSMLDDDARNSISTAAPRFGLSADIGFNKHFNHWGISESIGYSQFAQTNGNYINGRYLNSQQHLSVLQLSTTVFYSWKKFDFNSGLTFNRLINGDEQQNDKIINVYSMSNIQAGLTAGVTYNISPASNKIRFGVGAQYQWLPTINAGNTVFRDIQGLKISGKLSF